MSFVRRLLKVSSMAGAVGVYVPAMILQRGLGLARLLLLTWLFGQVDLPGQIALWGLGLMLLSLLTPLLPLGANHGLARYVSLFEARGMLVEFYRRIRLPVLACVLITTVITGLFIGPIASALFSTSQAQPVARLLQLKIALLGILNACVLALYVNMLGFLAGMRLYRLISAVELAFSVLFTVLAVVAVMLWPSAVVLLMAHLVSVGITFVLGMLLLTLALKVRHESAQPQAYTPAPAPQELPAEAGSAPMTKTAVTAQQQVDPEVPDSFSRMFVRIARFGITSMFSNSVWILVTYMSFWLVSRRFGGDSAQAATYHIFFMLSQPVSVLATAVWNAVSGHIAKQWETGLKYQATLNIQIAFKSVALCTLGLTAVIYLLSPLWVLALHPKYRDGITLVPGLLMFFQASANLGVLYLVAWLHERPWVTLLGVLSGMGVMMMLASWWMPLFNLDGASWAAGIGMFIGSGLITLPYLLFSGEKIAPGTYICFLSPALLMLAVPFGAAVVLAAVASLGIVALFTPWLFDSRQKSLIWATLIKARSLLQRST